MYLNCLRVLRSSLLLNARTLPSSMSTTFIIRCLLYWIPLLFDWGLFFPSLLYSILCSLRKVIHRERSKLRYLSSWCRLSKASCTTFACLALFEHSAWHYEGIILILGDELVRNRLDFSVEKAALSRLIIKKRSFFKLSSFFHAGRKRITHLPIFIYLLLSQ